MPPPGLGPLPLAPPLLAPPAPPPGVPPVPPTWLEPALPANEVEPETPAPPAPLLVVPALGEVPALPPSAEESPGLELALEQPTAASQVQETRTRVMIEVMIGGRMR